MHFSNHKDIKLVTSREKYVKIVMKPNFKRWVSTFKRGICCSHRKNRDQSWTNNIGHKQDVNI